MDRFRGKPEVLEVSLDDYGGLRIESSARMPEGLASRKKSGAPPTFVPRLILDEIWDRNNVDHLAIVAREDPIAARAIYSFAANMWDDGFTLMTAPKDGEEHPMNAEVQKRLEEINFKHYMTMGTAGERAFGHTWLQYVRATDTDLRIDEVDVGQNPVLKLDFWTPENAKVKTYDKIGAPEWIEITYQTGSGAGEGATLPVEKLIHASNLRLLRKRAFDRSEEGRPVLGPVWDYMVYLRFMLHSISWYAMKIGLGALVVKIWKGLSSEDKTAIETMMKEFSIKRFMMIDQRVEEISFEGAGGSSINFQDYASVIMDQIAAGLDIPKTVLVGQEQGAITGSEMNNKALYASIHKEQVSYNIDLRAIIAELGFTETDYYIEHNMRFAHDEMEQAQIRVLNAQADESESRQEMMKKGQNPMNAQIAVSGPEKAKDEDKKNNEAGKQ